MSAPFAAFESATANAAMAALANCTATVGAVAGVEGVFDSAYATSFGLTAGTSPALTVKAADVPAVAQDVTVVIGAASYTVTDVEPDGTGLILLRLDKSA